MPDLRINKRKRLARVNFTNRGLSEIFKSVRSLDLRTPDRNTVVEVARLLKDIKVEKGKPLGFPSISEFDGIDYIGYIVEKERLDKATGQWIRIDEYRIVGSEANNFKDSRLAHGNHYRYRIKSVAKITKREKKQSLEKFDLQDDAKKLESDLIRERLVAQQEIVASVDRITNTGLTSRSSTGQRSVNFDLSDDLRIETTADVTRIAAIPSESSIETTERARQMKNLKVSDPGLTRGDISPVKLRKLIEKSVKELEENIYEYTSFYYTSNPTDWVYVSANDTTPPPPPSSIKIIPNSLDAQIFITWLLPANSQRDIKGFNLYRRNMIGQAWQKIETFKLFQNVYVDKAVKFGRQYIYALTCVDVHDIESVLSIQTQAELNSDFATEKSERPLRWISGSGARPDRGYSQVFKKFFDPEVPVVAENNIVIGPTAVFKDESKKYLIRVTSLDMHEKKEFTVQLQNENVGPPQG